MARILIRPDDLARLARRLDAASDDLGRAGRRLARGRDEVQLNRADESFPAAHFEERTALVEANLRRLAAEFRIDAALTARTVDDADFDSVGQWTVGLLSGFGAGVGAGVSPGVAAGGGANGSGRSVGSWSSVAAGLVSLDVRSVPADGAPSAIDRPAREGGLFVSASAGTLDGDEFLDRLTERLERSSRGGESGGTGTDAGASAGTGTVWTRIVGELFAPDDEP